LEASDLRKSELAFKKLLFEKSQEALGAHAKALDLQTEVIGLKEEVVQSKENSAKLEEEFKEKSSQLEEQLGKLREELARKDELFQQTKEELTNDEAYAVGFEDAMAQVACVNPGVDLSQTGLAKRVVDGQLMDAHS